MAANCSSSAWIFGPEFCKKAEPAVRVVSMTSAGATARAAETSAATVCSSEGRGRVFGSGAVMYLFCLPGEPTNNPHELLSTPLLHPIATFPIAGYSPSVSCELLSVRSPIAAVTVGNPAIIVKAMRCE